MHLCSALSGWGASALLRGAALAAVLVFAGSAASSSGQRHVYCFGDPAFGTGGWEGDGTSAGWERQGQPTTLADRVVYDDSVRVMQSVGCHTIRAQIDPADRGDGDGTRVQRAQIKHDPSSSFGITPGKTRWYGFAFTTDAQYRPFDGSYNFNNVFSLHSSANGGPQAPINLLIARYGPAPHTSTMWLAQRRLIQLRQPRLAVCTYGGDAADADWPNEDGRFTARCYAGPVFVPARLYRVQMRITWGAQKNGAFQIWTNGRRWVDAHRVSNMWYRGTDIDTQIYPIFQNYRGYSTTVPAASVYYGGLITGASRRDVTVAG